VLPTSITLRNYRSFAEPVRLELRPITLLYGENNSGKSALLRALPLLSDLALAVPLSLNSPAVRGSSVQDLRWKGIQEDEDSDLGLGLSWETVEGVCRVEYRLTWFEEWRRLIIRRFSVWHQGGQLALEANWEPQPKERTDNRLTYEVRFSDSTIRERLAFQGLSPSEWSGLLPNSLDSILTQTGDQIASLSGAVQWQMATRKSPERISPYPAGPLWSLSPDGSDAPSVLAGNPEILGEVSSWYERNLHRRLLLQDVPPGRFRVMLQHIDRAVLATDLVENGEGSIQVLPVLTALALTGREEGPRILATEEPESHLHPSLQRALAEHICNVSAENPSSRIVLETHSEHLLLGVQLQILRGRLRPEDVQVYWVHQLENGESVADSVTFDNNARPQGGWPTEVFAEDTEMAREIIQARRERSKA
jgi:predicted ATPase